MGAPTRTRATEDYTWCTNAHALHHYTAQVKCKLHRRKFRVKSVLLHTCTNSYVDVAPEHGIPGHVTLMERQRAPATTKRGRSTDQK